jgi:hypothetical protein
MTDPRTRLDPVLSAALDDAGLAYERTGPGSFLVKLVGEHKLATMCWLVVGDHAVLVEAFVMRRPDEHHEQLYRFLLARNSRMYAVAWSLDSNGDVFLVGRLPHAAVTAEEIDRILGSVLSYADDSFDTLLEIGFEGSIRREWAWRRARGESTANLAAFARFADAAG